MEEKPKYRIGIASGGILIFLALFADLIGLIPFAEKISGSIFWVIASIILWIQKCGLLNWKRFVTAAISIILGWIPVLQALPQITLGIVAIIILIVIEDRTGLSFVKPLSKGVTPPRLPRNPVNSTPGVRPPRLPSN